MMKTIIFLSLCVSNLLIQCGNIEVNPGPKYESLTFCHWNLNSLTAHDSIKVSLFQAYVTQYNCDIIYLSEKFLILKKEEFVFIIKSIYLLLSELIFAL